MWGSKQQSCHGGCNGPWAGVDKVISVFSHLKCFGLMLNSSWAGSYVRLDAGSAQDDEQNGGLQHQRLPVRRIVEHVPNVIRPVQLEQRRDSLHAHMRRAMAETGFAHIQFNFRG